MSICYLNTLLRISDVYSLTWSRTFSKTISRLSNYYEVLKISPNASTKEIKEAYFKLSKEYHPDLNPGDPKSQERFIRLQEAYKVLSNVSSKKLYDSKINATINARRGFDEFRRSPRAWQYPDFTARDEYIRQQNKERMDQFNHEFRNTYHNDIHNFNKYYSRPRNLSPEELAQFYRNRKVINFINNPAVIFGAVIVILVVSLFSSFSMRGYEDRMYTQRQYDRLHNMFNHPFSTSSTDLRHEYLRERARKMELEQLKRDENS